ncbi:MAG: cytochrome c [Chloroflexi bacterium]|nr:cytochrome c [Chloroflexota bacterium]MBI3760622.1 cytochrome c [Chloroflexota bacterium]
MKALRITILGLAIAGLILAACGGGGASGGQAAPPIPAGDATAGKTKFEGTCAACHGPDAKGLPGLGKNLVTSEFAKGKTDAELVAFIKTGRPVSDALNTTGVEMPPKGGNAAFTDQDLADIIAYVRTLEK